MARALPLGTALDHLVNLTRLDLFYDPPLVTGKRASCVMQDATAEDLLRCILRGTGLDFIRLSSGLYVITAATETVPLYGKLRGIVVDADTGQPLPNAHVMLAEASTGTTANEAGMFAFARLKPGPYEVIATYVGYRPAGTRVEVPPGGDTEAEIALPSEPLLVAPIVIDGLQMRAPSTMLGTAGLFGGDLGRVPSAGATDVLMGLNTLLGVRANDATADLHIQGGETGEHQLRLDGAPVFLPLSLASFIGPFSPFSVGSVTVHKAGFGASQGSQISGVIDIEHELSVPAANRFDVQVDPLSVNARASVRRGDPARVQTTLMAAGRLSLWSLYRPPALRGLLDQWNQQDPFLKSVFDERSEAGGGRFEVLQDVPSNAAIGFNDLHLASRVRYGLLNSLYTSFYWGGNRMRSDVPLDDDVPLTDSVAGRPLSRYRDQYAWQTGVAQTRYETFLGARTLATLRLRGSYYLVRHRYNIPDSLIALGDTPLAGAGNDTLDVNPDDRNRVYEVGLEATLDHALGNRQNVRLGAEVIRTGSRFVVLGTQSFPIRHNSAGLRVTGFAEDEVTFSPHIGFVGGARLTYLPSHRSFFFEPRAALRLDFAESPIGPWSMRLSGGLYRQFINQFDVSSRSPGALISSTRFWLVADSTTRPPRATHLAAEWLYRPHPAWTIRLEGYQKLQHHTLGIEYVTGTEDDPSGELRQSDFLLNSRGTVSGAGIQVERRLGAGRANARYEYTRARRVSPGFFGNEPGPTPWDEPHRVELALDLMPLRNLTLLARWHGVWGRTWGFRQSYYDFVGYRTFQQIDVAGRPNVLRQIRYYNLAHPDSHALAPIYQLDLSAAYAYRIGSAAVQLRLDVLNVLDRRNEAEWYLFFDPETFFGEVASDEVPTGILLKRSRPLLPRYVSLALKVMW